MPSCGGLPQANATGGECAGKRSQTAKGRPSRGRKPWQRPARGTRTSNQARAGARHNTPKHPQEIRPPRSERQPTRTIAPGASAKGSGRPPFIHRGARSLGRGPAGRTPFKPPRKSTEHLLNPPQHGPKPMPKWCGHLATPFWHSFGAVLGWIQKVFGGFSGWFEGCSASLTPAQAPSTAVYKWRSRVSGAP